MDLLIRESRAPQAAQDLLEDEGCRFPVLRQLANQVLDKPAEGIIQDSLLDFLGMLCLSAPFADNEEECWFVAVLLASGLKMQPILPTLVTESRDGRMHYRPKTGMDIPKKVLTALTLFPEAMVKRTERTGAPALKFYRTASCRELRRYGHDRVAEHHEAWEEHMHPLLGF